MKKNLRIVPSNFYNLFQQKPLRFLFTILFVLVFGVTTKTQAQCIGPYQTFESFSATPTGWTLNTGVTAFTSFATAQSRSGGGLLQQSGKNATIPLVYPSIVTTAITNPKVVSFYVNKSAAVGIQITYDFQYSPDAGSNWYSIPAGTNSVNGVSITATLPTLGTAAGVGLWNLVTATFNTNNSAASYMFRISDVRNNVNGAFWVDDFSATTYTTSPNDNLIVVPAQIGTNIATPLGVCAGGTVTVAPTEVYNFYDNGGATDTYNISQINQVTFTPSGAGYIAGDRVRIQFLSYTGAATERVEVWDNNGSSLIAATSLLNTTATTITAGTTYISTISSDGSITIKFTSDGATNAVGFNIKVDCVRCPIPTGLASSAVGATTATVSWTATSAGAYDVYYNTTGVLPLGAVPQFSNIASTSQALSSLTTALTYYVWVRSRCGSAPDSYSPWSPSINFTTVDCSAFLMGTQPSTATQTLCLNAASTALTVSATGGTVSTYQWYKNAAATNSGGTAVGTNSASYTPVTTSTGTLYYYCVITSSISCVITSAVSGAVTINTVPTAPAPSAGSGATTSSITANWVVSSGATGYYLDVATDNAFTSMVSGYNNFSVGNVLTYNVTGLASGTTYYYRVRAANACGSSTTFGVTTYATLSLAYCTPNVPTTTTSFVNNFSTSGGITNISNLGTGFTTGGYANYSAQSCSQYPSSSVGYSITSVRTDSSDQTFFYYIWIDWNNDGDFLDAGETMLATTTFQGGPFIGSFAVPAAQAAGSYRMRISTSWFGTNTSCAISNRSETEDYTITVVPVPPCAASTPSALTSSSIFATGATISWTDAAMTPNSIYNYYWNTTGIAPLVGTTPTGTVTGANSANLTLLTLGTTYYFWVRSNCGTPSAWVGSSNFITVNVDIINMINGSSTTCNARFFDSGGSVGNYGNNEIFTYTITPSSVGSKLKVVFNSFSTENGFDGLLIYNGNSTAAPLLPSALGAGADATTAPAGSYYGTTSPGTIYSTAADGSLTFKFTSDGSVVSSGWDANVTCVTVPAITSFTPAATCSGTTPLVTLTGLNFTGATSVLFNGVSAAFTVVSDTSITATLPALATTGYISVTNAQAIGLSTTIFSVNPTPSVPNAGSSVSICSAGSTTLNGTSSGVVNTVLSQNFNGGTWPTGWSRTVNGGFNPGDFRTSSEFVSVGNTWAGNGYTGFCSYFYSNSISGGTSGDMITPAIDLSAYTSSSMTFWIYNSAGTDALNVYANNNGGAYGLVGTYSTYGSWTQITVNLNAYVGAGFNTVRIKFTGTSDGGSSNIGVDDIAVTGTITATYLWTPSTALSATNILTPVASPTSTTAYTLTTSFPSGCSASSTPVTVTVNARPTVTITTSPASVCGNSVIPVNVTGTAATYTWTSSVANTLYSDSIASILYVAGTNTTVVYVKTSSTATITATGTNAATCTDTSSVVFTVATKTFSGGLWSPAGAPPVTGGTDNLVFNSAWTGGSLSGCSCTNAAGATVFSAGETLSLTNGLTVSGGSVTFNNDASLLQTNNVANTGNITYMRNTTPIYKFDYTYWSTPVSPQTLFNVSPLSPLFYQYDSSIPNWVYVSSGTTMIPAKGYIIRAPSTWPLGPVAPPPVIYTASFIGVPNNGTYTIPIVGGANQLNLLGNPYPSALSATLFVNDPSNVSVVGGTLYFWTHNTPINASYQYTGSDYASFNTLGGVGTAATNPGLNMSVPNGKIASGQGFFIKGLANGNATFSNSMRIAGNNDQFYKTNNPVTSSETEVEKHRFWLDISNAEGAYKQMLLGYVAGGTIGLDRAYDGEMVDIGTVVTLYTTVETKKLSIQGRGLPFDVTDTVSLGYKSTINSTYSIALSDFDGLFDHQAVYLEDNVTGEIHDLKNNPYTFATTIGTFENRFVLRFTTNALGVITFDSNSVVVYNNDLGLHIATGNVLMKNVKLFDITGRLITSRDNINDSETLFTNLPTTQQVLLVQITSETGVTVTKKVVF